MNPRVLLAGLSLLGLAGCRGPEIQVWQRARIDSPVLLEVQLPEGPDRPDQERALAEALREPLSRHLVLVRPEDRLPRDPVLRLVVYRVHRGDLVKESIAEGAAAGAESGLRVAAESRYSSRKLGNVLVFAAVTTGVGAAVGTVGGTVEGAVRGTYHDLRLGYRPKHLACFLQYIPGGESSPIEIGRTDAWAVVKEMRPMANGEAHDVEKLRREEARALGIILERMVRGLLRRG